MGTMEAYLVTDRRLVSESFLLRLLRQAAASGVDRILIREADLGGRAFMRLAREALDAARGTRATVFVYDRVDVALAAAAHGVHLDRTGLPPDVARRIAGEDLVLGATAHTLEEATDAQEQGADYLLFGPIFPPLSRAAEHPPVGIGKLEAVLRTVRIPVYAVGGITPECLSALQGLPLGGVAMISAFVRAPSVSDLVRRIHERPWQ